MLASVNPWLLLVVAGLAEIGWAVGLKASDGFTRIGPAIATVVLAGLSFWLLAQAMRGLPVGTAYAVWVGIGAVGVAIAGIVLFGEAASAVRLAGVGLILAGIVLLKTG
jgi:quaternary ammonium compound-resistance protein SugE